MNRQNIFFKFLFFIIQLLMFAHFLRRGELLLAIIFGAIFFIVFVRIKASLYFLRLIVFIESVIWLKTAYVLTVIRIHFNEPYLRLIVILAIVIFVHLVFMVMTFRKRIKKYYGAE